jgi:hypothetical protein
MHTAAIERISLKLDIEGVMKISQENQTVVIFGQKFRALYIKHLRAYYSHIILASDSKWP